MFTALSLLGGLIFVALGGAALLRGTAGLAQLAGIPAFLIGLVVVAFGTSTPQLFTAVQATFSGAIDMAIATAIGASIFNIFATMGLVALTGGAVQLNKRIWLRGSLVLALIATTFAAGLIFFTIQGIAVPRWVGPLAVLCLIGYVATTYALDNQYPTSLPILKETKKLPPIIHAGLFLAGLFGLILGANLLVDTATQLTATHNLNPRFLGLTVLAVGTALPQLIASYTAFQTKEHSLLLGNLIGNTLFNLLGICGLLLAIKPASIQPGLLLTSFCVLAAATIAFAIFTHPAMRRFKRAEALLFLLAYAVFITYMVHSL